VIIICARARRAWFLSAWRKKVTQRRLRFHSLRSFGTQEPQPHAWMQHALLSHQSVMWGLSAGGTGSSLVLQPQGGKRSTIRAPWEGHFHLHSQNPLYVMSCRTVDRRSILEAPRPNLAEQWHRGHSTNYAPKHRRREHVLLGSHHQLRAHPSQPDAQLIHA